MKMLILYNEDVTYIKCIYYSLKAFDKYSSYDVYYENINKILDGSYFDMNIFDVVIIHYCAASCLNFPSEYLEALSKLNKVKLFMIQDDYINTERIRKLIDKIKPNIVYTVVPDKYINIIYEKKRYKETAFKNILTGYIDLDQFKNVNILPISKRRINIIYRGRSMSYSYGSLGIEKSEIGIYMKEICRKYGISYDIEVEENKRIYNDWFDFLSSGKIMLGTESGSNIFDYNGELKKHVSEMLKENSNLSYEDIYKNYLYKYDQKIKMNQISPKIFEAICLKTGLILYEGEYSGIIKPYENFIPLKKDKSNIEEVLKLAQDDNYIQKMVDRTYENIVLNEKYSYKYLIKMMENDITSINYYAEESK